MEEFKSRLEETKLLFKVWRTCSALSIFLLNCTQDLSLIGLAQGQDATLASMGTLSDRQDEIMDQLATLTGRVRETLVRFAGRSTIEYVPDVVNLYTFRRVNNWRLFPNCLESTRQQNQHIQSKAEGPVTEILAFRSSSK